MHMQFSMISWNVNFLWILRFEGFVTIITLMVRRKMRTFNMVHQCRPVWVHLATKRTRIYAFPRGITFFLNISEQANSFFTWRWQRCDPWRKFYLLYKVLIYYKHNNKQCACLQGIVQHKLWLVRQIYTIYSYETLKYEHKDYFLHKIFGHNICTGG